MFPPVTGKLHEDTLRVLQEEVVTQRDNGTPPFSVLHWVFDKRFERTRKAALRLAAVLLRAYEEADPILLRPVSDRGDLMPTDMRP